MHEAIPHPGSIKGLSVNPDDLIDGGILRDTDLEGEPPEAAQLGPFGRYVLIEELGRGGAAIVYRAHDPLLNRELALKRLRFGDLELELRFLREAELLAKLSHPGIVPIFDFGKEQESHYYTMPLAPGLSFDRWIAEHRPRPADAARMVKHAAESLAHAHERGVLHRDVKPANMLVSAEGMPLLSDFGLGRKEDPGATLGRVTESGEVMGTPSYMAPELATRDLKAADARCDVYSLGATLYEALTGQPPFVGTSALEILKKATTEEPVAPHRRSPETPADLEIICLKALEKDPDRRYASAREFADDLGRFIAGEPIRARRAGPMYRLQRFVGRRRALVSVALAGVLAVIAVLGYGWIQGASQSARRLRVANHLHEVHRNLGNLDRSLQQNPEDHSDVIGHFQRTLDGVAAVLLEDPENGEAHYLAGLAHALRFDSRQARKRYDISVALGYPRARFERAIVDCLDLLSRLPRTRTASAGPEIEALRSKIEADLQQVLEVPSLPEEKFARALLGVVRSKWSEAAAQLEAYSATTVDFRSHYWQGVAEMEAARLLAGSSDERRERLDRACTRLQAAYDRRKACRVTAPILTRLGIAQFHLGKKSESQDTLKKATESDPRYPDAWYAWATVLLALDQPYEAIPLVDKGMTCEPDESSVPPEAHAIRGISYAHREDRANLLQAQSSLEKALGAYSPDSPQTADLRYALEGVRIRLARFTAPPKDF